MLPALPEPLPAFIVFDCPNRRNCPTPYSHKGLRVVQSWDSRFCKLSQLSQRALVPQELGHFFPVGQFAFVGLSRRKPLRL